ncbi:hypothetical protein MMC16_003517 [Acarospora aff. strigata]|nr:hypothetical protein [Acarospora aff. strigata]
MALTQLSNELLEIIITHVLPEGFESAALTCRRIYAVCIPFIERHNTLRSEFHNFNYYVKNYDSFFPIRTSFDLIARIAVEPIVARYIRTADFKLDNYFTSGRPRDFNPDVHFHCGDVVPRLLAGSPYLVQAGLDSQEYYNEIEEDLQASRYSQHAAAFLLTLLPNVETLDLPHHWKPVSTTDKLIDAVVRKARQSHHLPCDTPSLAKTTDFSVGQQERFDLASASTFLALPHVRSFYGPSCVAMSDGGHRSICASQDPYGGRAETLKSVHLLRCCIDDVGIADFLKHTPRLRTLKYSHSTKASGVPHDRDWAICKFVTAIEREAGSHLVELSVSICQLRGSITPGKASMRNFQRLQTLEFPLEIASCNMSAAACSVEGSTTDHEVDSCEPFIIGDLVPASVSQLSLISRGTDGHEKVLERMFHDFAAKKDSQLPALREIHLSCPDGADNAYEEQCARLLAKTEKVGVALQLKLFPASYTFTWDDEQ